MKVQVSLFIDATDFTNMSTDIDKLEAVKLYFQLKNNQTPIEIDGIDLANFVVISITETQNARNLNKKY